jgi:putative transposase
MPQAQDQRGHLLQLEANSAAWTCPKARRLKQLADENGKLKKLLADTLLDNAALKDPLSKQW